MKISIISLCFLIGSFLVNAQEEIFLYTDTIPNSKEHVYREKRVMDKAGKLTYLQDISKPFLMKYEPIKKNGTTIVICPGGGYARLNIKNALFLTRELNDWGITVFILIYRLPSSLTMLEPSLGPLLDLNAALELVSHKSEEWGLDKEKIGLLGFSAGGHLAAMSVTAQVKNKIDLKSTIPNFLVLAWPVISFRSTFAHTNSKKRLLGKYPTEEQLKFFSPDEHVSCQTPPTFIVHANNDPSVSCENSIAFYKSLLKEKVNSELHIYQYNKHGFGLIQEETNMWLPQLKKWLEKNDML